MYGSKRSGSKPVPPIGGTGGLPGLQEPSKRFQQRFRLLFSAPRVLQEAFRRFSEGFRVEDAIGKDMFLTNVGRPWDLKIKECCETSSTFCDFGLCHVSRLRGPIWNPSGIHFGNLLASKMAETSLGILLGAAKSRSRLLFSAPRASQEASKRTP